MAWVATYAQEVRMEIGKGILYLFGHELKAIYEPFTKADVTDRLRSTIEQLQRKRAAHGR